MTKQETVETTKIEKATGDDSITEVKKGNSLEDLVSTILKSQEERLNTIEKTQTAKIEGIEKAINDLTAIIKTNPVDPGVTVEEKPKVEDQKDVGDKITIGNNVAPKPGATGSIAPNSGDTAKIDAESLKMENKSEDKEEEKDDKKEDKKEEMKKSFTDDLGHKFTITQTVRPSGLTFNKAPKNYVGGYDIIVNTLKGFGEAGKDLASSVVLLNQKFINGDFGTGEPTGRIY